MLLIAASLTIGQPLPPIALKDRVGRPLTMTQLVKPARVTLVNFWATWCGPCRAELPLLQQAHQRSGVRVLAINVGEPVHRVEAFLAREELTDLPVFYASAQALANLAIPGLPATLAVNRQGKLTDRVYGPLSRAQLAALLKRLQP